MNKLIINSAERKAKLERLVFSLSAPLLHALLIDKATSLCFIHWLSEKNDEKFIIYLDKNE